MSNAWADLRFPRLACPRARHEGSDHTVLACQAVRPRNLYHLTREGYTFKPRTNNSHNSLQGRLTTQSCTSKITTQCSPNLNPRSRARAAREAETPLLGAAPLALQDVPEILDVYSTGLEWVVVDHYKIFCYIMVCSTIFLLKNQKRVNPKQLKRL